MRQGEIQPPSRWPQVAPVTNFPFDRQPPKWARRTSRMCRSDTHAHFPVRLRDGTERWEEPVAFIHLFRGLKNHSEPPPGPPECPQNLIPGPSVEESLDSSPLTPLHRSAGRDTNAHNAAQDSWTTRLGQNGRPRCHVTPDPVLRATR